MKTLDKNHHCFECEFNKKNEICTNIIEFDAQCGTCKNRKVCLCNNPLGSGEE